MKYKKIFTFILLLCTIFGTLLFINPTSKAVVTTTPPNDLSGYTVYVPSGWTATAGYGIFDFNADVLFGNTQLYISDPFYIGYKLNSTNPFGSPVAVSNNVCDLVGLWEYDNSYQITFIFDVNESFTDLSFINWLVSNNATFDNGEEPEPDTYTISGQYQFNEEITWLYDTSEQEGLLRITFYVYVHYTSSRQYFNYMLEDLREDLDNTRYFMYGNEDGTDTETFTGIYAGIFTSNTNINMWEGERIIYFSEQEVSEGVYNWLIESGQFINDPTLDPNNPENPDSGNNPNNPNNPDFGTDTVRQIVNQVNAFLGIQILPGLSFRDILLICTALPLLMYILKVFLGG